MLISKNLNRNTPPTTNITIKITRKMYLPIPRLLTIPFVYLPLLKVCFAYLAIHLSFEYYSIFSKHSPNNETRTLYFRMYIHYLCFYHLHIINVIIYTHFTIFYYHNKVFSDIFLNRIVVFLLFKFHNNGILYSFFVYLTRQLIDLFNITVFMICIGTASSAAI